LGISQNSMWVGTINCNPLCLAQCISNNTIVPWSCSFTWFNTDLRGTFSVCSSGKVCCSQTSTKPAAADLRESSSAWRECW